MERSFERKNRNSSLTGHTNGVALFSADSFDEPFLNLAELIIAKQRNGPTGDVPSTDVPKPLGIGSSNDLHRTRFVTITGPGSMPRDNRRLAAHSAS